MTDEYAAFNAQFSAKLDDIFGIPIERRVLGGIIGLEIRPACTNVVE
jgi:hypothetical protein